ncbi:MAG: DUF4070 domain-containing protein [Acidobacteriota bacterium]
MRHRLDCVQLRVICPFPGTRLYNRLLEENRLFDPEWWLKGYPPGTLLFRPKGMTPEQLLNGLHRITKELYSFHGIVNRFFGISPWKRSLNNFTIFLGANFGNRKRYFKGLTTPQPFLSKN